MASDFDHHRTTTISSSSSSSSSTSSSPVSSHPSLDQNGQQQQQQQHRQLPLLPADEATHLLPSSSSSLQDDNRWTRRRINAPTSSSTWPWFWRRKNPGHETTDDETNNNNNHKPYSHEPQQEQQHHHPRENDNDNNNHHHGRCFSSLTFTHHQWNTIVSSVVAYWLLVSLIPIYNKFYFQPTMYPFPIATAGIQLFVVAALLGLWNILHHYYDHYNHRLRQQQQQQQQQHHNNNENIVHSWILGPHFWFKLQWCLPVGILFGFKYGVTNWGLHLVPAPTHLLLQSTDLVWTVLGAWILNGEVIQARDWWCVLGCIGGSIVLSWNHWSLSTSSSSSMSLMYNNGTHHHRHHHQQQQQHKADTMAASSSARMIDSSDHPFETTPDPSSFGALAVLINLLSPILLGLCISTLRLACTHLMMSTNHNCLRGAVVSSVELTSLKLLLASFVATVLAAFMEPTWWQAFCEIDAATRWGVLGGALLISLFQVNCTFLTYLTNAVTVGLVGQVKIIPQWIVAAIFAAFLMPQGFSFQLLNIVGAILIIASAAAFCYSNYHIYKNSASSYTDD